MSRRAVLEDKNSCSRYFFSNSLLFFAILFVQIIAQNNTEAIYIKLLNNWQLFVVFSIVIVRSITTGSRCSLGTISSNCQ